MPRKLKKLKIVEVSSVPLGAGEGVRVVLFKRDEQQIQSQLRNIEDVMADVWWQKASP